MRTISKPEEWIVKTADFSDISGRAGEYYRVVLASGSTRFPTSVFVTEGALGMIAHKSGLLDSGIARQEIVLDVVSEFVRMLLRTGWDPTKTPPRELEASAAEYIFLHGRIEGCRTNPYSGATQTKVGYEYFQRPNLATARAARNASDDRTCCLDSIRSVRSCSCRSPILEDDPKTPGDMGWLHVGQRGKFPARAFSIVTLSNARL